MQNEKRLWWQDAVFYQIYPRSFFDSDGDGEGDLAGITAKLDYIQSLGVDAVWSCPYFPSPKADNGYDVADYCGIDPSFGTLEDWKTMCDEIHKRGMKFLMDLVVNHSSDEHEWFKSARQSKDSPYRNYYIFRDGKPDGSEPSNWMSVFGGSTWEYNEPTNDYYLHLFATKQPDLNWEEPRVMEEIIGVMNFWADLGVDGFRLDAFNNCDKDQSFPDVPVAEGEKYGWASDYYVSRPKVDENIHEMYERVLGPRDLVTVAEIAYCPAEKALEYCMPEREEFDMLYFFDMLNFDQNGFDKFSPTGFRVSDLKKTVDHWNSILHGKGYYALYLSNHDQPRALSRFGNTGEYRTRSAKTLANAMYFLQGVPYIYQGDELGMANSSYTDISQYNDVEVHNTWREKVIEGGEDAEKWLKLFRERSRDTGRAPMAWDATAHGGFTTGTPWLPAVSDYEVCNAAAQENDPDSVLNFYRALIRTRKGKLSVIKGSTEWIDLESDAHMSYIRRYEGETLLSLNNFSEQEITVTLPEGICGCDFTVLLGNCEGAKLCGSSVTLRPWECITAIRNA